MPESEKAGSPERGVAANGAGEHFRKQDIFSAYRNCPESGTAGSRYPAPKHQAEDGLVE